ncbi:MAG: site-specific integrase, partial [Thermodesulfobacteriota bacterium]|nr:site-specific integrase [Thermodesulfobacteriota bacterium]
MAKWTKTNFPGVRYREHPTRKHGVQPDRYFTIRYKYSGKDKEEGLGWASQGMTAKKASARLAELRENQRTGNGEQTLQEKRQEAKRKRETDNSKREQAEMEAVTFSQIWEDNYFPIAKENKTKRAWQSEEGLYTHWIKPVIGSKSLKGISPIHLERLKKNMVDADRAARSIHYALAVVRQVFNYARNIGLYNGDNPVSKVKKPTADNRRLRFLTHEEAKKLLEALALKSSECHDMTLISLQAGLRFGEVAGLTWGDVDINKELMTLRDTKAGRNRIAYMTEPIKRVFKAKTMGSNDDLVFPGRDGRLKSAISNVFDRTVQKLDLNKGITDPRQKVVFHTCRHTFASWLV